MVMPELPTKTGSQYDLIISGAGPAGCMAALALRESGLKVCLIDKATFPRDKVCGDAIPGRAVKALFSLHPEFEARFNVFKPKLSTRKTALHYKNRDISFDWVGAAYTSARIDFDNFLFELTQEFAKTEIHTDCHITSVQKENEGFSLATKHGQTFTCKMLIGADGAHSVIAKQLATRTIDRLNHVGSVRAYYANIQGLDPNTTEVFFDKRYLPSYMWVFPLPGNTANVGFGMLSDTIVKRKVNLKKVFYEFIEETPLLKHRLANATQTSALEGFGLPLGATDVTISGTRYLLTGDAASLIDPISGDGIGNAMLSGKLAAEQAIRCFESNDFSAEFIKEYDRLLFSRIGSELKTHYYARRILAGAPMLLDAVFRAAGNPLLKKLIQKGL